LPGKRVHLPTGFQAEMMRFFYGRLLIIYTVFFILSHGIYFTNFTLKIDNLYFINIFNL